MTSQGRVKGIYNRPLSQETFHRSQYWERTGSQMVRARDLSPAQVQLGIFVAAVIIQNMAHRRIYNVYKYFTLVNT